MRGTTSPAIFFLAIIGLATTVALVTSVSSLAVPVAAGAEAPNAQDLTPVAPEAATSQPGSTDGIVWMAVVITAIILTPLLSNRFFWRRLG